MNDRCKICARREDGSYQHIKCGNCKWNENIRFEFTWDRFVPLNKDKTIPAGALKENKTGFFTTIRSFVNYFYEA